VGELSAGELSVFLKGGEMSAGELSAGELPLYPFGHTQTIQIMTIIHNSIDIISLKTWRDSNPGNFGFLFPRQKLCTVFDKVWVVVHFVRFFQKVIVRDQPVLGTV
jgi:hypothetical protein